MSDDPVAALRDELTAAASRRRRSRRRRRVFLLTAAVAGASLPAGAATTGVFDGSTPDGGEFRVSTFSDERSSGDPRLSDGTGRTCEQISFSRDGREIARSSACAPRGARTLTEPLSVDFTVAPGDSVLLTGSVASNIAQVAVADALQPPLLREMPDSERRWFAAVVPDDERLIVVARDEDGDEVARWERDALQR